MPPRITPPQVFALLVIWTVAILGLLKPSTGPETQSAAGKAPPDVACVKASREG